MQLRLLNFLVCPDCRFHGLGLSVLNERQGGGGQKEIQEGFLSCPGCGETYAIKRGIVRMLPHELREPSRGKKSSRVENIMRTAHGYDIHHLKRYSNRSQGVGVSIRNAANLGLARQSFQDYLALGMNDLQSLEGRVVLDAGCGGGRFMAAVRENGAADVVGLDLSLGGLHRAQALLRGIGDVHLIQGDITHPPFRTGTFDIVYSIGVIHHLADPQEGFRALESLLAPGGRLWIWVYGLEGMSLAYRLSHLVWLRRLTRSWSLQAKFRLCRLLSLIFSCSYLFPLRLLQRLLPPALVRQFPFEEFIDFSLEDTLYAFFDRLHPPYTHYLQRADVEAWLAQLDRVSVECPSRRGWVIKGQLARG